MFTSNKRVIRNGYLVAFEGEVMSDEEAAKRGLLDPEPEGNPKAKSASRKPKPKAKPVKEEPEEETEEEFDEGEEA